LTCPAKKIITNAKMVIYTLYCDKTIRNGKIVIKFAKEAPAPITINREGSPQHIKVDDDANRDKKFADLSCIVLRGL
tara:strand:- start:667 stop:897 length:231 start_codon:yes stop_codon:yes gene_type:complete